MFYQAKNVFILSKKLTTFIIILIEIFDSINK